jgi:hypothetical protein
MKRPDTRALLAAVSFGGLQLALFLALVPLAPTDAHADSASLGKKGELLKLPPPAEAIATPADASAATPVEEPAAPDTFAAAEVRDDILVLLADLPAPAPNPQLAEAAVVAPEDPDQPANPKAEMAEEEPGLVDLVLPSKTMGGY